MYYILFLLLIIAVLSSTLLHFRKKRIIQKINNMQPSEKCNLVDTLVEPLGYCYYCSHSIFSTTYDAWQKNAGYTYFYDYVAPRFQMVFDSLPVYFNYRGKTWLIEFWKGQYGINTGAEVGIYHADSIIAPEDYKTTLFTAAEKDEMIPLSFRLCHKNDMCLQITQTHWWLTAFIVGQFSQPEDLFLTSSITFPNTDMMNAFVDGLIEAGINENDIYYNGLKVSFSFYQISEERHNLFTRFWRSYSQKSNRIFCKLYCWFTNAFDRTEDRVLYLYYYLPFAFRKLLRLHRFNKRCHRKQRCMKKSQLKRKY